MNLPLFLSVAAALVVGFIGIELVKLSIASLKLRILKEHLLLILALKDMASGETGKIVEIQITRRKE